MSTRGPSSRAQQPVALRDPVARAPSHDEGHVFDAIDVTDVLANSYTEPAARHSNYNILRGCNPNRPGTRVYVRVICP